MRSVFSLFPLPDPLEPEPFIEPLAEPLEELQRQAAKIGSSKRRQTIICCSFQGTAAVKIWYEFIDPNTNGDKRNAEVGRRGDVNASAPSAHRN
jgi:hypothetical protein